MRVLLWLKTPLLHRPVQALHLRAQKKWSAWSSKVRSSTSRVSKSCRASVRPVTRSAPTGSIRNRRAKTLRLTKRCCVSLVSRRIRSDSFMSAANVQTCTIPHRRRADPGKYSGFWPGAGDPLRGQHFAYYRRAAGAVWISQHRRNRYPHEERRRFRDRATHRSMAEASTPLCRVLS